MKADILTLKALFQKDVRYLIPTFQRPYVWNQEDQWEPLWNDVRNIAEDYLDQLDHVNGDLALAEERTGRHFLGAVVLQQQPTPTRDLDTRHVIDGQQRLTTLQLLLDAAQEVFEQDEWVMEAKLLRKLVVNDEDYAMMNPDNIYKVWPTLVDQDAFRHAMSNHLSIDSHTDAAIVQAHEFFKLQMRQWLAEADAMAHAHAQALVTALMGLLEMVVIDLQTTDDANVIFETLNARGTPLLDSDLIKNSILHTANIEGQDSEKLYKKYWQEFDQTWWRTEVRQGRIVRPRIDVFLNYWLTMRTADEIQSTRFFPQFRRYSENYPNGVTALVEDIHDIGLAYRELTIINDWSPEGQFLYRWRIMDAGTTTPVVLWLFAHRSTLADHVFERSLHAIESYLVRRMICRMTTKDYNKLFLEILRQITHSDTAKVDDTIATILANQTADARLWPDDAKIHDMLLTLPLYQLLTRSRLRFLLEAVEDVLRSPKAEADHVKRNVLTIEHVMPQAWRQHWIDNALDNDGQLDETTAVERDRLIHTIGNLTLVNIQLNSALSNGPWIAKRAELDKHSVLFVNKDLLERAQDKWDEDGIRARGRTIAQIITSTWQRP